MISLSTVRVPPRNSNPRTFLVVQLDLRFPEFVNNFSRCAVLSIFETHTLEFLLDHDELYVAHVTLPNPPLCSRLCQ